MKTASQAGWYLSAGNQVSIADGSLFITMYDCCGNYLELFNGPDGLVWYSPDGFNPQDLPQSVLELINLWLGVTA
jgi:hypothetical protein